MFSYKMCIKALLMLFGLSFSTLVSAEVFVMSISPDSNQQVFEECKRVTQDISKEMGGDFRIKLVPFPYKRARRNLIHGITDADIARTREAFENESSVIRIPVPLTNTPIYAYTAKDIRIDGWDSIKSYKVVHLLGDRYIQNRLKNRSDMIYTTSSVQRALQILNKKRVDLFLSNSTVFEYACLKVDCQK